MKLKDAVDMGRECGLPTPAESINNVLMHSMSLFRYEDIEREEAELIEEAKKEGIKFCVECNSAMIKDDECYICRNFGSIGGQKNELPVQ